jgi:hypothetical protein
MDEAGPGFHYEYDIYEFESAGVVYVARAYTSEPEEAHFLRKEADGQALQLTPSDLDSSPFREAVTYLRERGKALVQYLSFSDEGYVDVPF